MEIVNGGESTEIVYARRKLIEYNAVHTPHEVPQTYEEFNILLKDDSGTVLGGILAVAMWNVMVVNSKRRSHLD